MKALAVLLVLSPAWASTIPSTLSISVLASFGGQRTSRQSLDETFPITFEGAGDGTAEFDFSYMMEGADTDGSGPNESILVTFGEASIYLTRGASAPFGQIELETPMQYGVPVDLTFDLEASATAPIIGEGSWGQELIFPGDITDPASVPEPSFGWLAAIAVGLIRFGPSRRRSKLSGTAGL